MFPLRQLVAFLTMSASSQLSAQTTSGASTASTDTPLDAIVHLDAFSVHAANDRGYRASQTISGSRFDRFVSETSTMPLSVQILNGQLLEDTNAITLAETFTYVTGAVAYANFTSADTDVYQRGFATLLHLWDGIRKPGGFDPIGADRIEVINGPTSVLFGITNPGGMVMLSGKNLTDRHYVTFTNNFSNPRNLEGTIKVSF